MDTHEETRRAWDEASRKHVREYGSLLAEARTARLLACEERLLDGLVEHAEVIHPQSGHGIDDHALLRLGAASVRGVDYSPTAVEAAQRRADELGVPARYIVAELPQTGLGTASADLVYTGKGALIWIEDLGAWTAEMHRLLRPGGRLFIHEAHPLVPLWTWDPDAPRVREDRGYFASRHVNDTFPGRGATEHQRTLAETVMTLVRGGFDLERFEEHPEPFWRPDGAEPAAAWDGRLPNSFSLLARRVG
ncbi:class I SAM-dependent methyltransferase [Brachybacterium sp. ACRRE]|uniref:class I SAM-dependent methyltransferase n=1 Tax=Brachybacterium sp. ACRRE TaxID=2918184 RepID=UPI001EF2DA35|nr:class I SAM-dependent methyltransferase [Brachybacterium sp. ACRRE]MCG7309158.1 class I SAM-dependent methyltransferase [Brachybacterium sp. ACRRE]